MRDGKTFVTDGNQRNRERSSLLTEIRMCSSWCKTVLEKSLAEPKRKKAFYSENGYFGKYGGRTNKRSQRDCNVCDGDKNNDHHEEGHMHVISNSYHQQASNKQQ